MPPPPQKDAGGPGSTALLEGKGHWVWQRDEGFEEFQARTRGFVRNGMDNALDFLLRSTPEHWFAKLSDARWEFRDSTPALLKSYRPTPVMLEIGRVGPETQIRGLDGAMYKGHVKTYWEDNKLCIHTFSAKKDEQIDYMQTMEVVENENEYLHRVEDKARELSGARYFKRHPYYWIDNQTRKTVRMTTYSSSAFFYVRPSMRLEVDVGKQCIESSGPNTEHEQGYFVITKRDAATGTEEKNCFLELEAFQTYTLTEEDFE